MTIALSVLDLAPVAPGKTALDSFRGSVALAQAAEESGYTRVWYAEHHNMATIASSATSILIGHVAGKTSTIRLGSGGIMLPNHSPLTIAEQFGTLETLYPGRIDLGLGRAPGSDQNTARALRRDPMAADRFPEDVLELQAFLGGESVVTGVQAFPGADTHVPLYILGSSLFGAQLAAALGLPFAFASHFAPDALEPAVAIYRRDFQPSTQCASPHVIAGVNVVAAEDPADAAAQLLSTVRNRVRAMISRGSSAPAYSDDQIDSFLTTREGQSIANMMRFAVAGTPSEVRRYLVDFAVEANADELIIAHQSPDIEDRLRSVRLTGDVMAAVPA